ncbi:MAG: Ribosomal protein [Pseudomonadota bacterium]
MGQKVNPIIFRLENGNQRTWSSSWFSSKSNYVNNVIEDIKIYSYFYKNASKYSLSKINVERYPKKAPRVSLFSSKPDVLISGKNNMISSIVSDVSRIANNKVSCDVQEVKRIALDANLVARGVADKLEDKKRHFKKVVKDAMANTMKFGGAGIKIIVSGRLGGAEIARTEKFKDGVIPLHTLRADIDYAFHEAKTSYGIIGVRVWICVKR